RFASVLRASVSLWLAFVLPVTAVKMETRRCSKTLHWLADLAFGGILLLPNLCVAQSAATPYQEGIRLLRNQKWVEATKELEQAVKLEPRNVEAHIALGIARLRSGNLEAGLGSFRRAVELRPSSAEAHYNLGLALREAGRLEPAKNEFQSTIA